MAIADQGGHYVPRTQNNDAESFMASLRANQHTGLIDPADMFKAMQAQASRFNHADDSLYWINMGPDNMGGQTTAVLYDNQSNVVYAGAKGGGVFKSFNGGITWHQVGGLNLLVSCMAQDADGVIYVGTGDGNGSINYNGLSQQGYSNSFIGTGLYTMKNDKITLVKAPTETEWLYINDIAVAGNTLLAATNDGLMYSTDKGQSWNVALEGVATSVKVASDNTIAASVDRKLYIGSDVSNLECHSGTTPAMEGDTVLPQPAGLLDVAFAASNPNVIYVAGIDANGNHSGIYRSDNKGENWTVALPSVTSSQGHNVFGGYGLYNHAIVVDPEDEGILYILGYDIWQITKPESGTGYYLCNQLTSNTVIFDVSYIHVGMHTMVFNPKNSQECFVGTDGGVFKGVGRFTFTDCNRNYVTTRMFNVALSGGNRILATGLDHGIVLIENSPSANTPGYGEWINPDGNILGSFSDATHGGPSAISTINPNTFFVTYKAGGLARTETAGADWVSTNFTSSSSLAISTSSFRSPIILLENYNDPLNPQDVWFFNKTGQDIAAGTTVQALSHINYPFNVTLSAPLANGDSILVHDPISAKFFVGYKDALYMTLTPLDFAVETYWYKVADKAHTGFVGEPLGMAISADGDNVFIGTKEGRFFRVSGLKTVVDDAHGTITDSLFSVTTTEITLPVSGQCVTSVAVNPNNANKVVVTCGNYGNDDYVFYSTNALAAEPTFTSKQGNLPKMPVYSSLIEMATGDVIIGTERGIYRSKNIANAEWTADSKMIGEVPVMDLKQQILVHEDEHYHEVTDNGAVVTDTDFPGIHNTGVIYAATYGRGVFRCENYTEDTGVPEAPTVVNDINVSMYPNPVQGQATLSFNLNEAGNVSYQVFDMTGRMVMNQSVGRLAEGEHQISINAENLSTGSYILRLNQGVGNASVKFMVY